MDLFADYKKWVINDYRMKKAENAIPLDLIRPTPAKLKAQCIIECKKRFERRDTKMLNAFFEKGNDQATFLEVMDQHPIDKFKPLANFLKEETGDTEDKNIELLAWLIEFEERPYEYGKSYAVNKAKLLNNKEDEKPLPNVGKEGETTLSTPTDNKGETQNSAFPSSNNPVRQIFAISARNVLIAAAILTAFALAIYVTRGDSCMYWTGDHYEPVSCDRQFGGDTMLVALDRDKIDHFKKITDWNSVTRKSIGRVWYRMLGKDSIELYTAAGFHPTDTQIRLKPITTYMIDKHVHPVNSQSMSNSTP